jgi:hypothetical protein
MDILSILVLISLFILVTIIAVKQAKERKTTVNNLPKGGIPTDVEIPVENPSKVPTKRGEAVKE